MSGEYVIERESEMIGAIVGDIAGSRFEWHNRKSKKFTFMKGKDESRHPCRFTDDSVMTLAVAGAYYGVPAEIRAKAETFLDVRLLETLHAFEREFCVAI